MTTDAKNQSLLKLALHVLTWVILLLFPFFLSQGDSEAIYYNRLVKHILVPMLFYAIIFYVNFFFLIEHLLYKKKVVNFLLINVFLVLLFTWLRFEIKDLLNMTSKIAQPSGTMNPPPIQLFIYKDVISMLIPIIIAYTVKTSEKWAKTVSEKKEREKDILNSELQHLKYQLQPHFFFNSLNTIYALIERSPSLAQDTVHRLGKLMRYMLYETESGKVSLNQEIDFMNQYIELMKLRLTDKTKIHVNFTPLSQTIEMTPLLFISLIENAFKHGISATQASELFFSLNVSGSTIRFYAENTNFPKNEKDKSGSGIGLLNLKKRLEIAYPGAYNFQTKVENNVFSALLEISVPLPNKNK